MNTQIRNNVQLIGNLGQNPEVKTLDSGKKVAKFAIAYSEKYTDASGKQVENTQWFNVVAWEGLAGVAEKFLHKGKQVAVNGKLSIRKWKDKDGNAKSMTEVVASEILLLGGSKKD